MVCLLFALKVKYPGQIHMIRGNHEDPTINAIYGSRAARREVREGIGNESDLRLHSYSLQ